MGVAASTVKAEENDPKYNLKHNNTSCYYYCLLVLLLQNETNQSNEFMSASESCLSIDTTCSHAVSMVRAVPVQSLYAWPRGSDRSPRDVEREEREKSPAEFP